MTVYIQFGGVQHPEMLKRSLSSVTSFVPSGPFRFPTHTQLNRMFRETARLVQPSVGTPYVQGSSLSIACVYRVSVCSMCVLV